MPVRVYEIAKRLGIESKEVLFKAKELGIAAARVPSSSLDKITAEYLEDNLAGASVVPEIQAIANRLWGSTPERLLKIAATWAFEGGLPEFVAVGLQLNLDWERIKFCCESWMRSGVADEQCLGIGLFRICIRRASSRSNAEQPLKELALLFKTLESDKPDVTRRLKIGLQQSRDIVFNRFLKENLGMTGLEPPIERWKTPTPALPIVIAGESSSEKPRGNDIVQKTLAPLSRADERVQEAVEKIAQQAWGVTSSAVHAEERLRTAKQEAIRLIRMLSPGIRRRVDHYFTSQRWAPLLARFPK